MAFRFPSITVAPRFLTSIVSRSWPDLFTPTLTQFFTTTARQQWQKQLSPFTPRFLPSRPVKVPDDFPLVFVVSGMVLG
jgi:hypothetical protein